MKIHSETISIDTAERIEWVPITDAIEEAVENHASEEALVIARTGHTSAALTTNELEDRLLDDMLEFYTTIAPPDDAYAHDELHHRSGTQPNAFGHMLASFIRRPVVTTVMDGTLQLGGYEEILFLEFDGPRSRTVEVSICQ